MFRRTRLLASLLFLTGCAGFQRSWVDDRFRIASSLLMRGVFSLGAENIRPIDWVICGGESGPGARPMHPDWA